jgi:beta-glucosidase
VKVSECVEVTAAVRNLSQVDGEATLFLFVRDVVASIARPLLELKGVRKIALAGGQRGQVVWRLPAADLAFIGPRLDPVLEPGRFEIHVGQSADPAELQTAVIELARQPAPA